MALEGEKMDVNNHNSKAWDYSVDSGNIWTQPVNKEVMEKAKRGE
ncbi:hypothetical protein [Halocella sp. SP3-1]|nr:hypothetical protein [Halocella sp. SP3-1]